MEGEVAIEFRLGERVVLSSVRDSRIDSFHTTVEAENEIVEVKAKT